MKRWLVVLLALFLSLPASAADFSVPKRDSADRKGILDAVRPRIEALTRGEVQFVVSTMRRKGGWAFAILQPQRPGGGAIDMSKTAFAADADFMDGLTTYALMRKSDGRWHLIDSVVGPTDVAFQPWQQWYGAPAVIFGF